MRIFILEDDSRRLSTFTRALDECLQPGDTVHIASDVDNGRWMFEGPYDLMFLDHDLGGETMLGSDHPNTGYQFVMHTRDQIRGGIVVVHSWNPEGAWAMVGLLNKLQDVQVLRQAFSPQTFSGLIPLFVARARNAFNAKAVA